MMYLSGTYDPMMIDMHVFPIVERIVLLEDTPWDAAFKKMKIKDNCESMYAYVHNFRDNELVKDHIMPKKAYVKLMEKWAVSKGKPMLDHEMLKE